MICISNHFNSTQVSLSWSIWSDAKKEVFVKMTGMLLIDFEETEITLSNAMVKKEYETSVLGQGKALNKVRRVYCFFKVSPTDIFPFSISYYTSCLTHYTEPVSLFLLHHPKNHLGAHDRGRSHGGLGGHCWNQRFQLSSTFLAEKEPHHNWCPVC